MYHVNVFDTYCLNRFMVLQWVRVQNLLTGSVCTVIHLYERVLGHEGWKKLFICEHVYETRHNFAKWEISLSISTSLLNLFVLACCSLSLSNMFAKAWDNICVTQWIRLQNILNNNVIINYSHIINVLKHRTFASLIILCVRMFLISQTPIFLLVNSSWKGDKGPGITASKAKDEWDFEPKSFIARLCILWGSQIYWHTSASQLKWLL